MFTLMTVIGKIRRNDALKGDGNSTIIQVIYFFIIIRRNDTLKGDGNF